MTLLSSIPAFNVYFGSALFIIVGFILIGAKPFWWWKANLFPWDRYFLKKTGATEKGYGSFVHLFGLTFVLVGIGSSIIYTIGVFLNLSGEVTLLPYILLIFIFFIYKLLTA